MDLRGGGEALPARAALRPKIFSISYSFLKNFGKIIGWRPLLEGWRPSYGESWIRPCECYWIQKIQWIITKSKNSVVTTSTTYLDKVTFSVIVVESTFSLLPLGRYLLPLATWNRYLSRHSSKNEIFYYFIWEYNCYQMWSILGDHINFVLCHDSLDSVNSAKVI